MSSRVDPMSTLERHWSDGTYHFLNRAIRRDDYDDLTFNDRAKRLGLKWFAALTNDGRWSDDSNFLAPEAREEMALWVVDSGAFHRSFAEEVGPDGLVPTREQALDAVRIVFAWYAAMLLEMEHDATLRCVDLTGSGIESVHRSLTIGGVR